MIDVTVEYQGGGNWLARATLFGRVIWERPLLAPADDVTRATQAARTMFADDLAQAIEIGAKLS